MRLHRAVFCACLFGFAAYAQQAAFHLNDQEYFERPGASIMVFQDIYPEGHQGGVNIIQHGVRVASNGDLRLGPTPGQWAPIPKQNQRVVDRANGEITVSLSYPDPARDRKGFNPIEYPDLKFSYKVSVRAEGEGVRVVVDLDNPLPKEWYSKVGFNLELSTGELFGKTWYLGGQSGIFPRQGDGPDRNTADGFEPVPLASGPKLSIAPETETQRLTIESRTGDLQLIDARNVYTNGWYVVRSLVAPGSTTRAVEWLITPHVIQGWKSAPVVHVSEVGYHPQQSKVAIIELDPADTEIQPVHVRRIAENGGLQDVLAGQPKTWGKFLRYNYLQFDFTKVTAPGMYVVEYGGARTEPFKIGADVFKRHVWQPTLEYFLPIQMCHMRVEENYRVWHGACHMDDARMAPVDLNHFDGYRQGPSTLTKYKSGDEVPGLNAGGWHDAGDDDLRIESQADEVWILASAYELFHIDYDDTTIDQSKHIAKIHQPDGKPDLLQQVEHGILTILGGYRSMGRVYRGIITPTLQQYTILGDTVNVTDNLFYDAKLQADQRTATHSGAPDDRWVFTEENAGHEYSAIRALAIAGRVLKGYNAGLAKECVEAAESLYKNVGDAGRFGFNGKIGATVELWLTTKKPEYGQALLAERQQIVARIGSVGWMIGRVLPMIQDSTFVDEIRAGVAKSFAQTVEREKENPFGVPYRPQIWGAGWNIQSFGVEQYYLHRAFPDIVSSKYALNALNFVLGVHPGSNTASFASGVGSRSMTVAYGFNRADWTYIPGGVTSGTALIRPDFPELKDFPYLWQQTEYVMGGGASNFMFLVLAADDMLGK